MKYFKKWDSLTWQPMVLNCTWCIYPTLLNIYFLERGGSLRDFALPPYLKSA
jgi:hypothetical protein